MNFKDIKKIHCIGIGGSGVSALARMMRLQNKHVSGSDVSASRITDELSTAGVKIYIGHDARHITDDTDAVVYTIATHDDNPEIVSARKRGIPTYSYPEMLGEISKDTYTIAVAGTHGKTTTTAMIADIARVAGIGQTVIVGSPLKVGQGNVVVDDANKQRVFIVEACEYRRSFLHLKPDILVITNIDSDHLDYYKDLADIQSAFRECISRVKPGGIVVCNPLDQNIAAVVDGIGARVVDYMKVDDSGLSLRFPGEHNKRNARAALAACTVIGVHHSIALKALNKFSGTERRFEYKGKMSENGALVYDDYAHHPTEIHATLTAAREKFPDKKIIAIFQPHLYSRTKILMSEFARSFSGADTIILAPIYAAREPKDETITSEKLAEEIKKYNTDVKTFPDFDAIVAYLMIEAGERDVLFTIGAGDIFKVGERLV